jgi:hypothetical protein
MLKFYASLWGWLTTAWKYTGGNPLIRDAAAALATWIMAVTGWFVPWAPALTLAYLLGRTIWLHHRLEALKAPSILLVTRDPDGMIRPG